MERIAHRGAGKGQFAENSMEAFENAITRGIRYIEFDLRVLVDGSVIVLHDRSLKRTAEAPPEIVARPVQWLEPAQIEKARLRPAGAVPTLAQVLSLLERVPDLTLMPELKDHNPWAVDCLLRELEGFPHRDRLLIQSFSFDQLRRVQALSDLQICPLYQFRTPAVDSLRCDWEAPMAEGLLLTPGSVARAQRAGRRVATWFLVGESWGWLRRRMESLGVDAMMVDSL